MLNKYREMDHVRLKKIPIINEYKKVLRGERKTLPRGTWQNDEKLIVIIRFVLEIKLKLTMEEIPKINRKLMKEQKLYGALNRFRSERKLIQFVYKDEFNEFDFTRVSPNYWNDINNIKKRLEYYLYESNYTVDDIPHFVTYDLLVKWGLSNPLKRYNHSPYNLINTLYPNRFTPYEFRKVPQRTATNKLRLKKQFLKMLKKEKISFQNIPKYVTQEVLTKHRFSGALKHYHNSPSKLIMDLFPREFGVSEFNKINGFWKDDALAFSEIQKLIKRKKIPKDQLPTFFTKKLLQENNMSGLLHVYNGSPIEIINHFFPEKFNITEFQRVPNRFWYIKENRVNALRFYCKQHDISRKELPNLSRAYFKKHFPRFISVVDRYYDSSFYKWIQESFPEYVFSPEEFNLHVGIDGQTCDSKEELMIHNYLVNNLPLASIKNGKKSFKNQLKQETYIPDWVIKRENRKYIVEYFGLYQSTRFPEYTEKTTRKMNYFNSLPEYTFIAIKPNDIRHKGFEVIKKLFVDKGLIEK